MLNGIDQAIADSAVLRDPTLAPMMEDQSGGRRRRRNRRTQKRKGGSQRRNQRRNQQRRSQRRSQRRNQQRRNQQGGGDALGYQRVDAPGLLLDNKAAYDNAGLNPDYYQGTSTEQYDATRRDNA